MVTSNSTLCTFSPLVAIDPGVEHHRSNDRNVPVRGESPRRRPLNTRGFRGAASQTAYRKTLGWMLARRAGVPCPRPLEVRVVDHTKSPAGASAGRSDRQI